MKKLTVVKLKREANAFSKYQSATDEPTLFGVTDGKAIGTHLEHEFRLRLERSYVFSSGSSARGIDFPELGVDMKATSIRQPQSSCPFKSAKEKIYGLAYSLLVFVYEKVDDQQRRTARLDIKHVVYVEKAQTADFQTTSGLHKILDNSGNKDDLLAFMEERLLPMNEMQADQLADEILRNPPAIGYLTISNALQWRLQYRRVIEYAGRVDGVEKVI